MNIESLKNGNIFSYNGRVYKADCFSNVPGYRKCFKITDMSEGCPDLPFVFLRTHKIVDLISGTLKPDVGSSSFSVN